VLRVLANLLGLQGFAFESTADVLATVGDKGAVPANALSNATSAAPVAANGAAAAPVVASIYQLDSIVRRAPSLQLTADARNASAAPVGACRGGTGMIDTIHGFGQGLVAAGWWTAVVWPVVWTVVKIVAVVLPLMICVAYLTLWERKAIGWSQIRPGPNRVGPFGLLTPIADAVKLIFKEIIVPTAANKGLFFLGPVMTIMPALAAWAVVPFGPEVALSNINAGLLYVMAISSVGVYGVILAGWASNSKYAFLGAMRAAAQMVSYEISMGFALVVVLMVAGHAEHVGDRASQERGIFAGLRRELPVVELAAAAADVRRVLHLGHRRNEPSPVRRGGRRVGNRRGPHDRLLGHGVRAVLPRRVHQHDRDLGDRGRDAVPRRLAARRSASCRSSRASSGSSHQGFLPVVGVHLGARHVPALSAMTRSCAWAGRCSFRCRWCGWWWSASGSCRR
jgi:hypothetical protein